MIVSAKQARAIKAAIGFLLVFAGFYSTAQDLAHLKFTHITTANGLSTQYLLSIMQDSRGLLWIGTTNGLNRYDGSSFKVYKSMPGNPNSLPGNAVWCMAEDKKGNLWLGTQTGLCYFEPALNKFTNYYHEPGNSNALNYTSVENLLVDEEDNVWLGNVNGLQKFNTQSKRFQTIPFAGKEEMAKNFNANHVYQIYLDRQKKLWVQVGGGNLYLVNKHDLSCKKMIDKTEAATGISTIYQDTDNDYWLCYWGKNFVKYDGIHPPTEKDFIGQKSYYYQMTEWTDRNKEKWIAITKDKGLCLYNKKTKAIHYYTNDITDPNSFAGNEGWQMIADKTNNLWITTSNGLELVEPSKQFFAYHYLGEKKDRQDEFNYGIPLPVFKDGSHYWIGLWHNKGFIKLDSNWQQVKKYNSLPLHSTHNDAKSIFYIHKDENHIYWVSTEEGIIRFDEAKKTSRLFIPAETRQNPFKFRKILPLDKNRLFIRTQYAGLYVFNKKTEKFDRHFTTANSLLPHDDVNDMCYDNNGNLWLATKIGLCKMDTATLTITEVHKKIMANAQSFGDDNCLAIDADAANNLWIGTLTGLRKFSLASKKMGAYNTANGLCNNTVQSIVVDKYNNVWMNTDDGISLYKQKEAQFQNFYKTDGLPKNSLDSRLYKDEDGIIYLPYAGKVLTADPGNIPFNSSLPPVIITGAFVKEKFYAIATNKKGGKYLQASYNNSSFTVNFAVLNFNSPNLNTYYYKLEGIDNEWHQSDRGVANYTSIPPGSYTLWVKGSNNSGIMNETGDCIYIIITPEWYQSAWCKALGILLVAAGIYYIQRKRIKNIRKAAALQQKISDTEMAALKAQMNPHFMFNCINSIDAFIHSNDKYNATLYLNKFAKLLRNILDSSKQHTVTLSKDIDTLKLYIEMEELRHENKFKTTFAVNEEILNSDYKVPPLIVQPFVENAILHGLKNKEGEDGILLIDIDKVNEKLQYTITDNGIGRAAAQKLMQNKESHYGMQMSYDRIKLFNKEKTAAVTIKDLYSNGAAVGTAIIVTLNT
jgi:ligand-binding sensor domain-containing protein